MLFFGLMGVKCMLDTTNGVWSMPVRHKTNPFLAQAVKRNMYTGFVCNFTCVSHLAKIVEVFKKCIPVMMVFNFL